MKLSKYEKQDLINRLQNGEHAKLGEAVLSIEVISF